MTRPAYDPAETYRFKATAFPFTAAATVDAEVKTIEGVDATDALESAAAAANAAAGLDTAAETVAKIAPRLIGTLSGAGKGTEICVYGGTTVTYTVDSSGNITNVVFS